MKQKNILLLMTDQQRMDYTGFSGACRMETPNMDRIAEGCAFTRCQTVDPVCAPTRTAMLTGRYPHQIGTQCMAGDLSRDIRTCPQALQENGYYTAAVGKLHYLQPWKWNTPRCVALDLVELKEEIKKYGYDDVWETAGKQLMLRNFCDYSAYLREKGTLETYLDSVEGAGPNRETPEGEEDPALPFVLPEEDYVDIVTADRIIDLLDNRPKDKPFYMLGSFCSPHKPFDPPKRYLDMIPYEEIDDFIPGTVEMPDGTKAVKEMTYAEKQQIYRKRRAYKAMIRLLDDQIGRIFDYLEKAKLLDDTVIVFASDHGEMLGDHYRIQKSIYWKESCTVPLAIRHPDYLKGDVCDSPVEITDVTATILDIAGLDPEEALKKTWPAFNSQIPCRSLMPIITGETASIREFTFSEFDAKWHMLETREWKYVKYLKTGSPDIRREELYHISEDPDETDDVSDRPENLGVLDWFRRRREYLMDTTPAAQMMWAPVKVPQ